ncbi:basic leucine zipper 34 [Lathyrus oleraceus]|uniref:Basic leucine zipper 34 n=1 Tax=Pisum sativum TaxID=3888 RepID=A0A9D4VQR3_PEA|nr:basic leucine zipper 34-like [Pisum sativum]KAI5387707.1 Basic leucine zipper 34 [Pisum sativum]
MAQLPPKVPIPNMTQPWPEFSSHQKMPNLKTVPPLNASNFSNNQQNPSWVDEFLDFSSTRRGAHRRSASDSVTFIEASMMEHCRRRDRDGEFERFDDEQLMSMFGVDEVSGKNMMQPPAAAGAATLYSNSNPSTPSDNNSINEEEEEDEKHHQQQKQLKHESDEDEFDECKQETARVVNDEDEDTNGNTSYSSQKITDPKRVKRILANRQSAQRSRVRKLQYISELERSVTSLQAEVSVLSPRVAFLDHQRLLLNVDNSALKQRIAALAQDKIFKDAHQEALKREIERLRQVYHQQNIKNNASPSPSPKPPCDNDTHIENEHLINV